jgi:hypothetical protein
LEVAYAAVVSVGDKPDWWWGSVEIKYEAAVPHGQLEVEFFGVLELEYVVLVVTSYVVVEMQV